MAKPELGLKRTCVSCSTRFYDLLRTPAVCPKCGTEQPPEVARVRRPTAADERMRKRVAAAVPAEVEPAEVELEEVEADETVEDAEELEEDAETLGEDLEVEKGRDEEI